MPQILVESDQVHMFKKRLMGCILFLGIKVLWVAEKDNFDGYELSLIW